MKAIVMVLMAVIMLSTLTIAYNVPAGSQYAGMPQISGISNSIGQSINVTFSRVSYVNEPTQWQVGPANPQNGTYKASGAWVLNNSGYQIFMQNSTPTNPSYVTYNLSKDTSSLAYFYMDQRFALNGTANAYIDLSESAITGLPATTGAIAASAGAAQNQLNINMTHVATGYNLTVGYFAQNAKGYQNYTTKSLTKTMLPLVFYEVGVYATLTKTTVYLYDTMNGSVLASTSFNATINGNLSKIDHVGYELDSQGSMILSFAYYLNHNTYTSGISPAISTPFVAMTDPTANAMLPFDPSATNASYTQGPSATNDYRGATGSLNSFSGVVNANNPAAAASSLINSSSLITTTLPATNYGADNVTNSLRLTNATGTSFTASLHVNSFNTTDIMESLNNYLQGYLYQLEGPSVFPAGPKQVDITFYVITSISVGESFGSSTASSIANNLYTAIPGILTKHKLSLVDSATNAVAAGQYAGDFLGMGTFQSAIAGPYTTVPVYTPAMASGSMIVNPMTGQAYPSLQAAGFPDGSYISNGHVVVPQITFYGFTSQGVPIFNEPLTIIGLTGAALATQGYFQSSLGSIYNNAGNGALSSTAYTLHANIGSSSTAVPHFLQDTITAAQNYLPFMGATVANIGANINTGLTGQTVGNLGHSIMTTTSQTVGALLAGATSSNTYIYRIGASMSELPSSFHNATAAPAISPAIAGQPDFNLFGSLSNAISGVANSVYSTANAVKTTTANSISSAANGFVNDAQAVVSPVYTTAKNLGNTAIVDIQGTSSSTMNSTDAAGQSIYKSVQGSLALGSGALNGAGHYFSTGVNSAGKDYVAYTQTVDGAISSVMASDASMLSGTAHGVLNWVTGIFNGAVGFLAKYWVYIVLGIVGIIIAAIVILSYVAKIEGGFFGA